MVVFFALWNLDVTVEGVIILERERERDDRGFYWLGGESE